MRTRGVIVNKIQDIRTRALNEVERMPDHELRRLLERMAVTDPIVVHNAIERMDSFDAARGGL